MVYSLYRKSTQFDNVSEDANEIKENLWPKCTLQLDVWSIYGLATQCPSMRVEPPEEKTK